MTFRHSLAALILLAALGPGTARAQSDSDKAAARELTVAAYAALDAKDFAKAADLFKRADGLYRAPTITLGLGRAYLGLGKLLSAQEAFTRAVHDPLAAGASAQFTQAVADAQRELASVAPRVPGVVISVEGTADAKVTVDGIAVPSVSLGVKRPVDPGQHVIAATAAGFVTAEAKINVLEGRVETVTLQLRRDPNAGATAKPGVGAGAPGGGGQEPDRPAGSLQRTLGFVGVGVGGAGLVLGAITGGLVLAKHADIAKECTLPGGVCPRSVQPKIDSYHTVGTVSTVGFIAGGALAAAGLVTLLTAPKAPAKAGVAPMVGLGFVGVDGRF
jgi:hypothetical protein